MTRRSPHLNLAKKYWQEHVQPNDLAIDATCGNGHDTLFLAQLGQQVFAFDIQEKAIQKTQELLTLFQKEATLHQLSHAKMGEISFPKKPRLIVYNLGYLPKGDKQLTTKTETTLESIKESLSLLSEGGALSITCYPGHEEGEKEERAILDFLSTLPSHKWLICHHRYINRLKGPSFFWVLSID